MNIDDYRAMVAQEEANQEDSNEEQPNAQAEQTDAGTTETVETQTSETQETVQEGTGDSGSTTPTPEEQSETIKIGEKEVSLEEVQEWERGYLRQSDYTRKTQELAQQRRELEEALALQQQLQNNPEIVDKLRNEHNLSIPSEEQRRTRMMEEQLQDLLLEQELSQLEQKYNDFDRKSVLTLAHERRIPNLEDAYLLSQSMKGIGQGQITQPGQQATPSQAIDVEAIKAELREELRREFESNVSTSSIISSGGGGKPISDNSPTLSDAEMRVAKNMGMKPDEYAKWKSKR